jgi:large subunit ribosomal protein L12
MTEEKKKEQAKRKEKPKEKKETKKSANYVYAALLLHSAGKKIDEANMKKVVDAAGVHADTPQIKALVASLEGVSIDDAIRQSVIAAAPAAAPAGAPEEKPKEEKKDEKSEEKKSEEAAAGLSSLFG